MNKKVLMIMGGALVMAIFVALIVQAKLSPSDSSESSGTEILVATKKLLVGEKITADSVHWQPWPDDAVFSGVIKKADQKDPSDLTAFEKPLRRNIESGEPITTQAIISDAKGGSSFLAASIGPGMRAVAISVNPTTAVAGFIAPGDYVDIILSYQPKFSNDLVQYSSEVVQHFASQTILSNVKVLAVDQEAKGQEHEVKTAKTITLEVTKQGAEKLAIAQDMGSISLSLRKLGEEDTTKDKAPSLTTDTSTSDVIKRVNNLAQQSKTTSDTVRVYNGTSIQNVPVRSLGDH